MTYILEGDSVGHCENKKVNLLKPTGYFTYHQV